MEEYKTRYRRRYEEGKMEYVNVNNCKNVVEVKGHHNREGKKRKKMMEK
jgi:hypothetical protein